MLVLASRSPRRRALLEQLGLRFVVRPADVDESAVRAKSVDELVVRLANSKAQAAGCRADELVIGADTVVSLDGEVFGKPGDAAHAATMLRRLSGRRHEVWSGIALRTRERESSAAVCTQVWLRDLDERDIAAYVRSGEPFDKAGAYAIQGLGASLVARIDGCYGNVVGLPIARLVGLLAEFGVRVP